MLYLTEYWAIENGLGANRILNFGIGALNEFFFQIHGTQAHFVVICPLKLLSAWTWQHLIHESIENNRKLLHGKRSFERIEESRPGQTSKWRKIERKSEPTTSNEQRSTGHGSEIIN